MESVRVIIDEEAKFAGDFDFGGLSKGGAVSILLHASIMLLIVLATHHQKKSQVLLTEVTMVDQIIPEPEPEEAPPPPKEIAPPPEQKNVWDFLKQVIPVKANQPMTSQLPIDLPKKMAKPELSAMPDALKLGDKKNMDKPMLDKPLDLVGRKAVAAPAGMDVNPLQMNKKQDSLAMTSQLPSGISLNKSSSWLPQKQAPVMNADAFAKRANLQARGGGLADMPAIQKPIETKKKAEFDTSSLKIERSGNTFKIFGALQNRQRLGIVLPKYPRWAEEQGLECSVSIHFFVFPNGTVKDNLFVEQSSNYSEMDGLATKALLAFQFAPLPPSEKQEEQEGVIVFYFRLSR
jgi:TonB family protein